MTKKVEWLQAVSLITGTVVAITKAVIQYNEFKREQGTLEYTRELQRRAWDKVIAGELAEAKVGEMTIRSIQSVQNGNGSAQKNSTTNANTTGAGTSTPGTATVSAANASAPNTGAVAGAPNTAPREGA